MPQSTFAHRVLIDVDPFVEGGTWYERAKWPADWISAAATVSKPVVVGYRLPFTVDSAEPIRIHVSADERYELYVDGELIGRGPDRGDFDHWNYESYELEASVGSHLLAARVWSIGDEAPYAQLSRGHGFLLASETHSDLNTGTAAWQGAELAGYTTLAKGAAWGTGLKTCIDGRSYPWGWESDPQQASWPIAEHKEVAHGAEYANDVRPGRLLIPTILPAQHESEHAGGRVRLVAEWSGENSTGTPVRAADNLPSEQDGWQQLLAGTALTVPPGTLRRVLVDLDDYLCAYPQLNIEGGLDAEVRINWQECLVDPTGAKGDRDQIEGKLFRSPMDDPDVPVGDAFISGGGTQEFSPLWWEAGRYVEILVRTAEQSLTITGLRFIETRYPYENRSSFTSDDGRLAGVQQLAFRTLQMCSHETTMDCPFYEQLQYAGDARIQCLVAYVSTGDDRLARQALLAFDHSRASSGITTSRYPSVVRQHIPGFSLWWIGMVHDFAAWRGDLSFVRQLMPGVRAVLEAFRANVDDEGLLSPVPGWGFVDWVDGWEGGAPPDTQWGPSSIVNLQLSHIAGLAAELETWLDEPAYAELHRSLAERTLQGAQARFWDTERGLYADNLARTSWSEHAQCLAVLAGDENGAAALNRALESDVARTSVYFNHYLFEALAQLGRTDVVLDRMSYWFDLLDAGLRTVIEEPEPTRSDCHAWGAHPIFHLFATVLGIRPTGPGMSSVTVSARPGRLGRVEATLPSPFGPLTVRASGDNVTIDAPNEIRVDRR